MLLTDSPLDLAFPAGLAVAALGGILVAVLLTLVCQALLGRGRGQHGPPRSLVERSAAKDVRPEHDPFVQGSALERRRAPRRRGGLIEVHISDAEGTAEPVLGHVVDRSIDGICLWVGDAVPAGTILSVRPAAKRQGGWVQVEVRHCREDEGGWELGCRYVQTPSWSVRMLFG